ncbi:MAG: hypothetical protein JWO03_1661 [Bacteroidetes bacterium]|nr:hypothetical protein [Bacteroidota bacterium]
MCLYFFIYKMKTMKTMKIRALGVFVLMVSMMTANAQDKSYFLYKSSGKGANGQYEIKSNDHYIVTTKPGLTGAALYSPYRILDLTNNVGIMVTDKTKNKWYHIESLDTMYKNPSKLENLHESKVINGHKCDKYSAEVELDFSGGMVGSQTYKVLYAYTIWITTDMKTSEKLSKYLMAQITGNLLNAEINGIPVKIEYKQTMGKRVLAEGALDLEKATNEAIKDNAVNLPWLQADILPAAPRTQDITRRSGNQTDSKVDHLTSIWTNEKSDVYEERLKKLFEKVTGKPVSRFTLETMLTYM